MPPHSKGGALGREERHYKSPKPRAWTSAARDKITFILPGIHTLVLIETAKEGCMKL